MLQSKQHYYLSGMKKVLYLAAIISFFACNKTNTSHDHHEHDHHAVEGVDEMSAETEALYADVMATHDEVMPKTENIHSLLEGLKEDDSEKAIFIKSELEKADDAMMSWMRDFQRPEHVVPENRKTYYESEKIKIENVKTMMLNSIEMATSYKGEDE